MKLSTTLITLLACTSHVYANNASIRRKLEEQTLTGGGLEVKILGKSGKMSLVYDGSKVQITMSSLKELDADGNEIGKQGQDKHSINNFAQTDFSFDVAEDDFEMYDAGNDDGATATIKSANSTNAMDTTTAISARAKNLDFKTSLQSDDKSTLEVQANVITSGGLAGTKDTNFIVAPGDFKWNFAFKKWNWCTPATCNGDTGQFVDLEIIIKGNTDEPEELEDSNSTHAAYDLGNETELELPNTYTISSTEVELQMPDGYPQITQQDGKTVFVFRFEKPVNGDDITYDPLLRFTSSSTTTNGGGGGGNGDTDGGNGGSSSASSKFIAFSSAVSIFAGAIATILI